MRLVCRKWTSPLQGNLSMTQLDQSSLLPTAEASENWASKVAREINVVGGGTLQGIGNGISETASHPLEFGANLATSAAFMLAMRAPGWIKAPAAVVGVIGSLDFGIHAVSKVGSTLPAIQDLWSSDKNIKRDRAVVEQNLGPLAFNVAGMALTGLGAGYLGGRMAPGVLALRNREVPQFSSLPLDRASTIESLQLDRAAKIESTQFHTAPVTDDSWHQIFETEFPPEEQQPYDFLHSLAADGSVPQVKLQLTKAEGKTVAFSITSDYGDLGGDHGRGLLLPYIAVEKNLQGQGIGGAHLEQTFAEAKADYPTAKGMVVEVEDPHAPGISAEDAAKRQQRIDWYAKHDSYVLDKPYLIPSSEEGADPLPARLIWRDFGRGGLDHDGLNALIGKIYQHGYELPADHPVVQKVLAS
jgi:hypothetical protein